MDTTKQIIISKVKLVKGGIRINYEKYRDSYWDIGRKGGTGIL